MLRKVWWADNSAEIVGQTDTDIETGVERSNETLRRLCVTKSIAFYEA